MAHCLLGASRLRRDGLSYVFILLLAIIAKGTSWIPSSLSESSRPCRGFQFQAGSHHDDDLSMEALSLEQFKRRRETVERKLLQDHWQRPPNPFLSPTELISCLLKELHDSGNGVGVLTLLESSTPTWRQILVSSVGAPEMATHDQVAQTLKAALGRPHNQFAILVGNEDPDYQVDFPTDPLDYQDGTCWVECRLRNSENDELLVAMGWSLEQRKIDGAWLVAALDWQDFREEYRPGIGREEWVRICG